MFNYSKRVESNQRKSAKIMRKVVMKDAEIFLLPTRIAEVTKMKELGKI